MLIIEKLRRILHGAWGGAVERGLSREQDDGVGRERGDRYVQNSRDSEDREGPNRQPT